MKQQTIIILLAVILVVAGVYYIQTTFPTGDGVISPINSDQDEQTPDVVGDIPSDTVFRGWWKQQVMINYDDGTSEYVGASNNQEMSLSRNGKTITDMTYIIQAKAYPSDSYSHVAFDFNLDVEFTVDELTIIKDPVEEEYIIEDTITDDDEWQSLVSMPLDLSLFTGGRVEVFSSGNARYKIDNTEWIDAELPVPFNFDIQADVDAPDDDTETDTQMNDEIKITKILTCLQDGSYYNSYIDETWCFDDMIYLRYWVKNNGGSTLIVYWHIYEYGYPNPSKEHPYNWWGQIDNVASGEEVTQWCKFGENMQGWHGVLDVGFSVREGYDSYGDVVWKHTITDTQEFYCCDPVSGLT